MRAFSAAILAAALAGAAVSAFAQDKEPERNCDGSTYEIVQCQKAKLAVLDKRHNAAYQKALQMAQNAKQREQLRAAQRLWIKYRDADCEYYELGEGTIARIEGGECMMTLTRQRAEELERAVEP